MHASRGEQGQQRESKLGESRVSSGRASSKVNSETTELSSIPPTAHVGIM